MTIGRRTLRTYPRRRGASDPATAWAWACCELAAVWWPSSNTYRDFVRGRVATMSGASTTERHAESVVGPDNTGSTTGAYATFSSIGAYRAPGAWTVAGLVYSDGEAASQAIIAKGANSESAGQNHNYWLCYDQGTFTDDQAGNGWLVGFENAASAGANITAKYVTTNPAGTSLVMGCLDPQAQELRVYVDGVLQRTRTSVTAVAEDNAIDLTVGRFMTNGDSINRWNGIIQAVWMWNNRAFTTGDALRFARDPFAMFREPPVHYTTVAAPAGSGKRSFVAGMIG